MADRVLITGARAAAAIDLARDFAAAGWEPHLADSRAARIARWSKVPAEVHRYPAPVQDGAGFRRAIVGLLGRLEPRLVVPVCEEVFHLAAPALAGPFGSRLFAPALSTLRLLHDKLAFARACAEWGIAAPESHPLDSVGDVARYADDSAEWVFKPRFSRFGETALVGPTAATLAAVAFDPARPWLVQRRVRGWEACFYAVARDGALTAFAAYRSDWRLRGGACFAFDPLVGDEAKALRGMAATIARGARITGQFACDAMVDGDGRAWPIECNPRATSGVHLLAGSGRLARAIAGDSADPQQATPEAAYLAPAMLLFGLRQALRHRRLRAWGRSMADGHDALSRPGDRAPLLGALADAAGFTISGWRHGLSAAAATTRDIEWNGEDLP